MGVRIKSTLSSHFVPHTIQQLDIAVLEAATDIHRRSDMLAPQDTGNLKGSGKILRVEAGHYVVRYGGDSGGFSVPYAKRRHYENKKNPQTLLYLERAGEGVKKSGIEKYLKGK